MVKITNNIHGPATSVKKNTKSVKTEKFSENELIHDFKEYASKGCCGVKNEGLAYSKFCTSTILHSIFKNKISKTYDFNPEGAGDCYFDGLCIAINGKPVTDYREVTDIDTMEKISCVDFYFIQSKMHKNIEEGHFLFNYDEFESFVDAVTKFLNNGSLSDENPNELICRYRKIYKTIKPCLIQRKSAKVNVHFYFASYCNKNIPDPYVSKENSVRKNYISMGFSDISFTWADKDFLCSEYRKYNQFLAEKNEKKISLTGAGSEKIKSREKLKEEEKITRNEYSAGMGSGRILQIFGKNEKITGALILNDDGELVLAMKASISEANIKERLKRKDKVIYSYEKNNTDNKGCKWMVKGQSIKIVR